MKNSIKTKIEGVEIIKATEEHVPLILEFIKKLAEYEKMGDEVVATEEILRKNIFEKNACKVVFAMYDGTPVAFSLYFYNFSTFLGKPGLYLEDLFVIPEMRGKGIGKLMLSFLANEAVKNDCGRFEWWCLDWNKPSIDFYLSLGAIPMDEWTTYRMTGEALNNLANAF